MTILEACGNEFGAHGIGTISLARVVRHALAVGAEMDRKSRGNKLDKQKEL